MISSYGDFSKFYMKTSFLSNFKCRFYNFFFLQMGQLRELGQYRTHDIQIAQQFNIDAIYLQKYYIPKLSFLTHRANFYAFTKTFMLINWPWTILHA